MVEFEKAHQQFLTRHLELRSGERKGRLLEGIIMRKSLSCKIFGGRCLAVSSICIQNMKFMIGTASRGFWTLLFCRHTVNSALNVTVIKAISRIWTARNSAIR